MLYIIYGNDEHDAGNKKIKDRKKALRSSYWRKHIENHKEAKACKHFNERILPRDFAFTALTGSFLKKKTEDRNKFMPA